MRSGTSSSIDSLAGIVAALPAKQKAFSNWHKYLCVMQQHAAAQSAAEQQQWFDMRMSTVSMVEGILLGIHKC